MLSWIDAFKNRWWKWFVERAEGPGVEKSLALIAFTESIVFPIPTVIFLMAILLANSRQWFYYALYAALFSVLGGIGGYIIGSLFFNTVGVWIIDVYNLNDELAAVKTLYETHAFWVIIFGALTPLPYKVFTLTAGFVGINLIGFIIASIIGRSLQFLAVGIVLRLFGRHITKLFLDYFLYIALVIAFFVILLLLK